MGDGADLVSTTFWANRALHDGEVVLSLHLDEINEGPLAAGPHSIEIVISEDQEIGNDDDRTLHTVDVPSALGPSALGPSGASHAALPEIHFGMQSLAAEYTAGYYIVGAVLDADDDVDELDESNNVTLEPKPIFLGAARFDLVVTDASHDASTEVVPGDPIDVTVTVENSGDEAVVRLPVRAVFSDDGAFGDDWEICSEIFMRQLAPGEQTVVTLNCEVPRVRGQFLVLAEVDPDDAFIDDDRADNGFSLGAGVEVFAPEPDLIVSAVAASRTEIHQTEELELSAAVTNTGTDTASEQVVSFYLAGQGQDTLLCDAPLSEELAPGASATVTAACRLDGSSSGIFHLVAVADGHNDVFETEEGNNEQLATQPLRVLPTVRLTTER